MNINRVNQDSIVEILTSQVEIQIREKINCWTDQCMVDLLVWIMSNGGFDQGNGFYYFGVNLERIYSTPEQLIKRFKSNP